MVAVRSAHLNPDQQFLLEQWVTGLNQDKATAKRLTQVYESIEKHAANSQLKELVLWRGREMIEILITLSMDRPTLVAALLFRR